MSLIEYRTEGAVAVVTLNRPPVNALSADLVAAIDEAIGRVTGDDAVRAAVITGEPHFAAGADITGFQAAFDAGETDSLAGSLSKVVRRLEQAPKPVIAAVRGFALGGGLELAMAADFIYLAEDARVGQPEIKLGIIPGAGGTQRLVRLVGIARARDLVYTGRFMEPEEAMEIGLAQRVLPGPDLLATALEDAARLAKGPTRAIAAAKRAMIEGWSEPIDDALAIEIEAFREAFATEDAREGVAAFLEKREPRFSGK